MALLGHIELKSPFSQAAATEEPPAAEEAPKAPEAAAEETKPEESSEKKEELPDLSDPELNQAATKIQASFKGYQTRKEFQAKKQADGAEEGTAEPTAEGGAPAEGTAEAPPAEEPPAEQWEWIEKRICNGPDVGWNQADAGSVDLILLHLWCY